MVLTTSLSVLSPVVAQQDLAARELANGDRLARDGKMEQADQAWRRVIERYPDAREAAQALDRLGTAAYPVEEFDMRGRMATSDSQVARLIYERLAEDYRESPQAPRALFKLGLIYSDPGSVAFDLDEAYARFSALVTIYPGSEYRDGGLFGMGDVLTRQGECSRGLTPLATLDAQFPDSGWADDGLMLQAACLLSTGYRPEAMRLYQDVRDRFPDSSAASVARARNTHLVRLMEAEAGPVYESMSLTRLELPSDWQIRSVDDLQAGPENQVFLVDGKSGVAHLIDSRGRISKQIELEGASAVWPGEDQPSLFADGAVVQGGRVTVLTASNGNKIAGPAGLLARDPLGRYLVWDRRSGDLLRFSRELAFERVLVAAREVRIDAAAAGADGTLVTLDAKAGVISFWSMDGEQRTIQMEESEVRRAGHMALDFLGNIYLMDTGARVIEMRDPEGALLARLTSGKADEDPFPRPEAMAVNERGEILVYDQRRAGIVVIR
jgi:TolA-binding protein